MPSVHGTTVHLRLSRPRTVSYCMTSAMERPSALDQPHTSPRHARCTTLMSFGCTETAMKASGVVVLMSAAFGGSANIINGKAWTETLRAYCLIIDVLLRRFH